MQCGEMIAFFNNTDGTPEPGTGPEIGSRTRVMWRRHTRPLLSLVSFDCSIGNQNGYDYLNSVNGIDLPIALYPAGEGCR